VKRALLRCSAALLRCCAAALLVCCAAVPSRLSALRWAGRGCTPQRNVHASLLQDILLMTRPSCLQDDE
jgi:hypothetical protein